MRSAQRRTLGAAALAAALTACLAAAQAASAGPPIESALDDGCQRNPGGLLTFTSPSWVFVGAHEVRDTVRKLEGSSLKVHTAGEDLPEAHASYDLDFNVKPDAEYLDLLAGTPESKDGNWAEDADRSELHVEWESGVMPTYVWPTDGDRIAMWGQWIWDCGHWGEGIATDPDEPEESFQHTGDYFLPGELEHELEGNEPNKIRGEQTELHPMQGVVVNRAASWAAVAPERQTDAIFSSNGTQAYATETCARDLQPVGPLSAFGPDLATCVNDPSRNYAPVAGKTFRFHVPAPPKPSAGAQLRYRDVQRVQGRGATDTVTPVADGLDVSVTFDSDPDRAGQAFGKTYFVGWEGDTGSAPEHLRLRVDSVLVKVALDPNPNRPQQLASPPGEYNLYLDVNGRWQFIGGRGAAGVAGGAPDEWAPELGAVVDGQLVTVGRTVDFFVPPGRAVRIDTSGRECDLPRMDPCVANAEVSDGNDQPGEIVQRFGSAAAALGPHKLANDAYEVSYSIERIEGPGMGPSPPGSSGVPSSDPGGGLGGGGTVVEPPRRSGCADTFAPRTAFDRKRSSLTRTGLALRGTASDRGCSGGVAQVTVSIAHHDGARCRWVQPGGKLSPLGSCRRPVWVAAKGRSTWAARVKRGLPAGTWVARSRAIDRAGNVEIKRRLSGRKRSFLKFAVR